MNTPRTVYQSIPRTVYHVQYTTYSIPRTVYHVRYTIEQRWSEKLSFFGLDRFVKCRLVSEGGSSKDSANGSLMLVARRCSPASVS